ncbi:MAG: type VI secretion system tip protein VgrG [Desulfohalobiaceae bacterium]|nr:type VI secretion system tip protein VgrG [Desulfohalobiaceae bacterium]
MAELAKRFSFISLGMPGDTFGVVRFQGSEGLSRIYHFEIDLISRDPELDLNEVIQNPARFTILRDEGDIAFNGMLISFEQMHQAHDYSFYKGILVPRMWWLSQTRHNQIFVERTVPQILEEVLKDGGLDENGFDLRLKEEYKTWDYVCQYRETHLNFVTRWMEREGMYFYFEQTGAGEKLIITDTKMAHGVMTEGRTMTYSPPSALDSQAREEVVKDFCCRQTMLPRSLRLKDYNYERPSLNVEGLADVYAEGRGEVYMYGDHFKTTEEGNKLAQIRAEELKCWEKTFHGQSTVPFIRPGYRFDLQDHYRADCNQNYLTVEASHEGSQAGFMLAGLSTELSEQEKNPYYLNSFTALPAGVQYRPRRETEKPRFYGSLNARIDAAGSGKYAEVDEQGRYKVILPFDRSGRHMGKASTWLRMMQPYAGPNQGMHFPLHKGTEVLLNFIDGDPDRPVIAGAVPNPETRSPVTSSNQTKSVIQTGKSPENSSAGAAYARDTTAAGDTNYIEFDDAADTEHIRIHSGGNLWLEAQGKYGEYHKYGNYSPVTGSNNDKDRLLNDFTNESDADDPPYNPKDMLLGEDVRTADHFYKQVFKEAHVHVSGLDTVNLQEGNIYDFGGYWNYNLGNCYVEEHMEQGQGAELNKDHTHDLLNKGGPEWNRVDWAKANDGDKLADSEIQIGDASDWQEATEGEADTSVWVEKSFGNSYSYTKGHSIEVTEGDSLEIQRGGEQVEIAFRGDGSLKSWSRSGRGKSEEKKWNAEGKLNNRTLFWADTGASHEWKYCRDTGKMLSYSVSHQGFNSHHSFDFNWANTASAAFTFAAGTSFDFKLAAHLDFAVYAASNTEIAAYAANKNSIEAYAGLNLSLAAYAGLSLDLSAYAALKIALEVSGSLSLEAKVGLGIAIELDARTSGKIEFDGPSGKFKVKAGSMLEAEKAPSLKAAIDTLRARM